MSNLLIGSSNIARFYKADSFTKFRPYTLSRCTEYNSFKAIMDESTDKNFVISVVENFVCNRVKSEKDDALKIIEEVTTDFFNPETLNGLLNAALKWNIIHFGKFYFNKISFNGLLCSELKWNKKKHFYISCIYLTVIPTNNYFVLKLIKNQQNDGLCSINSLKS